MDNLEFKQKLIIALASNTEFTKLAENGYSGKFVGYCVANQINLTLRCLNIPEEKYNE